MIIDRYYQIALLLFWVLFVSSEIKSSIFSMVLGLAIPILFAVIWLLFNNSSPQDTSGRKLPRAWNRMISHIVAPKSDFDWIEQAYNAGLTDMRNPDQNKRLVYLRQAIAIRRVDAGMLPDSQSENPIRALRPRVQRDLVLLARLLQDDTALSTLRITDPSCAKWMADIVAYIASYPPLPLKMKLHAEARTQSEAIQHVNIAPKSASQPALHGPPNPFEARAELEETALNAIYLKRHWPLGTPCHGRSHLGGQPSLPAHTPWPRHEKNNQPLHFLAQIDCAEMPSIETQPPLPPDGTLLFFADINSEMDWGDGTETSRVLYVPAAEQVTPKSPLPDDLPDIGHHEGEETGDYARPHINTYPIWPVTGHKIRSYDTEYQPTRWLKSTFAEEMSHAESRRHLPPPSSHKQVVLIEETLQRDENGQARRNKKGHALYTYTWASAVTLAQSFPFCGAVMHSFMQKMIEKPAMALANDKYMRSYYTSPAYPKSEAEKTAKIAKVDEKIATLTKRIEGLETVASKWKIVSEYARPGATLSQEFRDWTLANGAEAKGPLFKALLAVAQRAVTDARLLKTLPDSLFEAVDHDLRPSVGQSEHIMLGHPQNKTNSTQGHGVRLLLLDSDFGVDFMFCDMGVVEFYILPKDLANRDFSRAYALTAGG